MRATGFSIWSYKKCVCSKKEMHQEKSQQSPFRSGAEKHRSLFHSRSPAIGSISSPYRLKTTYAYICGRLGVRRFFDLFFFRGSGGFYRLRRRCHLFFGEPCLGSLFGSRPFLAFLAFIVPQVLVDVAGVPTSQVFIGVGLQTWVVGAFEHAPLGRGRFFLSTASSSSACRHGGGGRRWNSLPFDQVGRVNLRSERAWCQMLLLFSSGHAIQDTGGNPHRQTECVKVKPGLVL
ncbi:hypothetical protein FB45DRAFT_888410 [Roridomyces roridus]|uniref:Uncharacterized protein n=1 Tax=Roridomyces roridus TaxID=1738132 RepID=A0AAD7CK19_9AGAR|nr:hypothetical protein FB45DRAFT_888410 [Roridomyces roridus]